MAFERLPQPGGGHWLASFGWLAIFPDVAHPTLASNLLA
jgi:hypothetical protein